VPVPMGGARIPESMPTVYPEGFDPTKPQEAIDYGDKYREVEANRNVYQNLKKELAKLGPVVEAFLRHEDHFKTKGDPTNEQHKATY
jgi:regulator of sigma D